MQTLAKKGLAFLSKADPDQLVHYVWAWKQKDGTLADLSPEAFRLWFAISKKQMHTWTDKQLSCAVVALVRENITAPPPDWWDKLLSRILELETLDSQSCANLLHGFARMLINKQLSQLEQSTLWHVRQDFERNLSHMNCAELSNCVWAVSKLGMHGAFKESGESFWSSYWTAFEAHLPNMAPIDLVMHFGFWERTRFPSDCLLALVEERMLSMVDIELALSFVGRLFRPIYLGKISEKTIRHLFNCWFVEVLGDFQLAYGLLCWSKAKINPGALSSHFWEWFWDESQHRIDHFDGESLGCILLALCNLNVKPPRQWLLHVQSAAADWILVHRNDYASSRTSFGAAAGTLTLWTAPRFLHSLVKLVTIFEDMPVNQQLLKILMGAWMDNFDKMRAPTICSGFLDLHLMGADLGKRYADFWALTKPMLPQTPGKSLYFLLKTIITYDLSPPDDWMDTFLESVAERQHFSPAVASGLIQFLSLLRSKQQIDPLQYRETAINVFRVWHSHFRLGNIHPEDVTHGMRSLCLSEMDPGLLVSGFWRQFFPLTQNHPEGRGATLVWCVAHFGVKAPSHWINDRLANCKLHRAFDSIYSLACYAHKQPRFESDELIIDLFSKWLQTVPDCPVSQIPGVVRALDTIAGSTKSLPPWVLDEFWTASAARAEDMTMQHLRTVMGWVLRNKLSPPLSWRLAMRTRLDECKEVHTVPSLTKDVGW